ncbi:MAG: phosphatidate cytidylyltransferase, partial [Chloroflexi bacterium]|nr:phosphatidate cytidylyltransferase [Chloroflexota bacterium]
LHILPLGIVAGAAAVAGDLAESALKRGFGAKASGGLIPGHGGVLDRFDSLLLVLVLVYCYAVGIAGVGNS